MSRSDNMGPDDERARESGPDWMLRSLQDGRRFLNQEESSRLRERMAQSIPAEEIAIRLAAARQAIAEQQRIMLERMTFAGEGHDSFTTVGGPGRVEIEDMRLTMQRFAEAMDQHDLNVYKPKARFAAIPATCASCGHHGDRYIIGVKVDLCCWPVSCSVCKKDDRSAWQLWVKDEEYSCCDGMPRVTIRRRLVID
jgi:hypothetical protein